MLALPEHIVGEIVEGELYASPRPAARHAVASSALGAFILSSFGRRGGGPGGWWILIEPELHLGPDVLVPDIAGWRRDRMPAIPDVAAFELAPDWICEVVSPGTRRLDRMKKMPVYARNEIAYAWLVDPIAHTLEAFRLVDGGWKVIAWHEGEDVVRVEPFEAIELALSELWLPTT
ncbi:MAG: Uma2 family endonuclease [Acidobacteriota bacterium]|nr:Uma2 family endonuclease [Acidobacteriota bacterium]